MYKIGNNNVIEFEKEININIADNIILQGKVQERKAELDALNYFKYIDSVIRRTSKILFPELKD